MNRKKYVCGKIIYLYQRALFEDFVKDVKKLSFDWLMFKKYILQ